MFSLYNQGSFFKKAIILILLINLLNLLGQGIYITTTKKTAIVEVTGTEVKRYGESDKYLVFTKEHGVLENTDTLFALKFNSSDIQAKLSQKGRFDIIYYGIRLPLFSWYPNVMSAIKIKEYNEEN